MKVAFIHHASSFRNGSGGVSLVLAVAEPRAISGTQRTAFSWSSAIAVEVDAGDIATTQTRVGCNFSNS